ncbi:solute carrier family 22 member 8 isoform X1 [Pundamilia nyererei]|uniref:Solute carrier family 22 member 8 isoform X1 n=2 Tax=Pundamilia nyererei TaxID=303518 RepID=A0A9Y3RVL4_9CICH|nr:PREDICTED: solute carrier family 22 member 8-like isoform X1 [Pundamilia nyererei]
MVKVRMNQLVGDQTGPLMSPLQLSVYWRLALIFFFTAFLFFLDIFTTAVVAETCRHGNDTGTFASWLEKLAPNKEENQSALSKVLKDDADWRTESGIRDSVCGWTDWLSYGQMLFMTGLLLGSLFGGAISDRYGKRPVLLISMCVHAVCGLVPAVFPQPLLFLILRCLTGICCCCINICAFSLAVEWTPPDSRLWPPAFLPFCFSLGTMGGAPLAWLNPTWTRLHLSLALPQIICLPLYLSIPESPRWLLLKKRTDILDRYRSNSPADNQRLDLCGISFDILWNLFEHRLIRCWRLLRPVLFRAIRSSLLACPIGSSGTPANEHARSVPQWSCLLRVVTPVQVQWYADAGYESGSVGETLRPGCHLYLHSVQH